MRTFLPDLKIAGAMLVSRCGKILDYTIPSLIEHCDYLLIMMDNEDEKTIEKVNKYKRIYKDKIIVRNSGFRRATEEEETDNRGLYRRFKPLQGQIRDTVLQFFRDEEAADRKVDIILWPDSDEIFNLEMPESVERMWNEGYKAVTARPITIFGDFNTISADTMAGHSRIFRYFKELTAIPTIGFCHYRPLKRKDRLMAPKIFIHLLRLTKEKADWRENHWSGRGIADDEPLWRLEKDIRKMTSQEIEEILKRKPDLNVYEYSRGGDKRIPVGTENASKAMQETKMMLDEMKIRNFLAFGTCLGIARDKELIRHDWDVDFIVLSEDLIYLDTDIILEKGFTDLKIKRDLPRVKTEDGVESEELAIRTISFKKYGVRVDLDPAHLDEDGKHRVILKGRKIQKFCAKHPKEWFETPEIVEYRGIKYSLPSPVGEYLESNYGKNWSIPAYGPTPWSKRKCMSQSYACKKI